MKNIKNTFIIVIASALILLAFYFLIIYVITNYLPNWVGVRQGISHVFTGLISAIIALSAAYISFKSSHLQEESKRDREIINDLNSRFTTIFESMNKNLNSQNDPKVSYDRSPLIFSLASLYQDWEHLSKTSNLVKEQSGYQQTFILKTMFRNIGDDNLAPAFDETIDFLFTEKNQENKIEDMKNVYLGSQEIKSKNLSRCDFSKTTLNETQFSNCLFEDNLFDKSKIRDVKFYECDIKNIEFNKLDYTPIDKSSRLDDRIKINFTESVLTNVKLKFKPTDIGIFTKVTFINCSIIIEPEIRKPEKAKNSDILVKAVDDKLSIDLKFQFEGANVEGLTINERPARTMIDQYGKILSSKIFSEE